MSLPPFRTVVIPAALLCAVSVCAAELVGAAWERQVIDGSSKGADGVRLADVNGDGLLDVATGWEQGGAVRVCLNWLSCDGAFDGRKWTAHTLSGVDGVKHVLVELLDLDADGDLDAITTGEVKNLGVIWYENPVKSVAR